MEATEAQTRSPFLALPAELRNSIYEYLVCPEEYDRGTHDELEICVQKAHVRDHARSKRWQYPPWKSFSSTTGGKTGTPCGYLIKWRVPPTVTQVSQQVRREALPLHYSANVFVAYSTFEKGDHELTGMKLSLIHI